MQLQFVSEMSYCINVWMRNWLKKNKKGINVLKQHNCKALKGRKLTARGNALGLNEDAISIAPRLIFIQKGVVAWGKIKYSELKVILVFSLNFQ